MSNNKNFEIGQDVFVHRQREYFSGRIADTRPGWLRIAGKGIEEGTIYDEWFPIEARKQWVTHAN